MLFDCRRHAQMVAWRCKAAGGPAP